jgi:hypothetical protein
MLIDLVAIHVYSAAPMGVLDEPDVAIVGVGELAKASFGRGATHARKYVKGMTVIGLPHSDERSFRVTTLHFYYKRRNDYEKKPEDGE